MEILELFKQYFGCKERVYRGDKRKSEVFFLTHQEDITKIRSQKEKEHELVADQNRNRSTARSAGLHDVHRHGPVNRSVDRGKGTVDRLNGTNSRLVPVDRAGRPRIRVGRPAGRPTDAFCSPYRILDSFSFLGSNTIRVF